MQAEVGGGVPRVDVDTRISPSDFEHLDYAGSSAAPAPASASASAYGWSERRSASGP